ncbi:MAG: hypothetical protein WCL00_01215 [Bacteroidota bacterium]
MKKNEILFFSILFTVSLVVSYPINFPDGKPKGGTEFFADKAAYYVYLPATFIYKWDVKKFPEKIDERTRGFTLHYKSNRLIIKTTCGVALMLTPFFIPTHLIAKLFSLQPDGFSEFYQLMMTLPGIFYLVLGLFFLRRFLAGYCKEWISYLAVFLLFAGTNLFFYSVDEGLMSHVYSFFLFSLALYMVRKMNNGQSASFKLWLLLCFVFSLAILIRPTNIFFMSILAFLDIKSLKEMIQRFRFCLMPKQSLSFLIIFILTWVPQMLYWHYLSGHYIYNSYPDEGFTNLAHPMIIPFWFAPLNGLFLYTPLALFFIAGLIFMFIKRVPNALFIFSLFTLLSSLFSSWLTWFFGGSFGCRPLVEYFALLSLPFAILLERIFAIKNLFSRSILFVIIGLFSYYSLRMSVHYNCFEGSIWSWDDYKAYLSNAGILHFPKKTYNYLNDFENNTLPDEVPRVFSPVHSRTLSTYLDSTIEFGCKYAKRLDEILDHQPLMATTSLWYRGYYPEKCGAFFVCSVDDTLGRNLFYKSVGFDNFAAKNDEWTEAGEVFHFPEWLPPHTKVSFYIWNPGRSRFYVDDISIKFE